MHEMGKPCGLRRHVKARTSQWHDAVVNFTIFVFLAAATQAEGGIDSRPRYVHKTVFSSTNRGLFVAGLEGSGHHTIHPMLRAIERASTEASGTERQSRLEVVPEAVQAVLYRQGAGAMGAFLMGQPEERQNGSGILVDREITRDNFRWIASLRPGKFTLLNSGPHTARLDAFGIGRMSYPNFGGWDKPIHNPDVRLLAKIAEEARLDFRVIVLMRTADEILRSTVFHRRFGPEQRQATILALSGSALAAQLRLLDPRFFVCVNSSGLSKGDASVWAAGSGERLSLQDLLAVDDATVDGAAAILAHEAKAYFEKKTAERPESEQAVLSDVALEHLAAVTDVLMDVCGL